MVPQIILEKLGLSGPSPREMRAQIRDATKTIEIKHGSICAARAEKKRQQTGEIPAEPVANHGH